jgi:hypothetical protein
MVEICAGVLGADRLFARFNHDALSDPACTCTARTRARSCARRPSATTDHLAAVQPWIAGIGGLVHGRVLPRRVGAPEAGGALCVWFHHYEQSDETVELVLRTLDTVFPNVEVFFSSNLSDA